MPTFKVVLDNPASSLALNAEYSQVVIAGSHIFKIYSIGDCVLTEKANLYAAKNQNPNFSSSEVVWNTIDENKLATVARNGVVVTWDLNKSTRSKLDTVFKDHERPVNKVSFHPFEAPLLISGLQGGLMKLFDLRRKEAVTTFIGNTESVRDIQFNPHISYCFAAGTEDGNVQFWDTRRPDRTENQFREHRGPVHALDWHPERRQWIATASRDHTIKVWDLNERSNMYNTIKTVGSVGRVKWRPNKSHHLASCALTMDCSISVWDIRRPYLPFSAFLEHRDVTTGIAWQGNSSVLLSVGKDSTLFYHPMEDATHPIENTNPVALSINSRGLIAAAKPKNDAYNYSSSFRHPHSRKTSMVNDSFVAVCSSMSVFDIEEESPVSTEHIIESAIGYRLTGRTLAEVCEHNAAVAKRLNRHQIVMTWQIVQILFGGPSTSSTDYGQGVASKEDQRTDANVDNDQKPVRHVSGDGTGDASVGTGGASAEEADTETDDTDNHDIKLRNIARNIVKGIEHIYVTHLAPLPSPVEDEKDESSEEKEKQPSQKPSSLLSVNEQLLSTHASQVIRMIPGGLDVLGVYVITPLSELNNSAAQGKLRTILTTVHKATSKYYLGTRESPLEKIILFRCTQSSKTGVKSFDLSEQGTSPVTGTLKTQETKWIQLNYNYSLSYPIYFPKEKSSQSLCKIVLAAFKPWAQSLLNTFILFDGKILSCEDELVPQEEKSSRKKGSSSQEQEPAKDAVVQVLDVQMLENQNPPEPTSVSEFQECSGSILFKGTVTGRAFLNIKATASEGFEAVRTDLIRSFVSRWEMHCDSLVEEPHGSSAEPVFHEPPRRVFLKGGVSPISLCDYLFPGDYACDACESAKEILDLNIFEEDVEDSVEKWADLEEFRAPETLASVYTNDKRYEEISSVKNSHVFQFLAVIAIGIFSMVLSYFLSTSKR